MSVQSGFLVFLVLVSVALAGCSDDDSASDIMPMIRVAHLAPEVPTRDDASVDFVIVDQGRFAAVDFGDVSGYAALPRGDYLLEVFPSGVESDPLATIAITLQRRGTYTIVAYRDSAEAGLTGLFVFEDVDPPSGNAAEIVVAHGVDDSAAPTLTVVDATTREVLVPALAFGTQSDPIEVRAGSLDFGFGFSAIDPTIDAGPFRANVLEGERSILVAIDRDTRDDFVTVAAYAIGPSTRGAISPLPRAQTDAAAAPRSAVRRTRDATSRDR